MTQEEFIKSCNKNLNSIYTKIDEEEKQFLSYLVYNFNQMCERNSKALEYIETACYCSEFHKQYIKNLIDILSKGEGNNE